MNEFRTPRLTRRTGGHDQCQVKSSHRGDVVLTEEPLVAIHPVAYEAPKQKDAGARRKAERASQTQHPAIQVNEV